MPQLPGSVQVYRGERNPTEAPTQSIASAMAPWASVEQTAGAQIDYESRVKKARQAVEATQAGLDITKQLDDLHSEYRLRNDYNNFEPDFDAKAAAIKNNIVGALQDPEVAQHVGFEFDKHEEEKRIEIRNLGINKMQDAGVAALEGMEQQAVLAAGKTPEAKDAVYAQTVAAIHELHAAGILSATDAEKRVIALGTTIDKESAAREIMTNPAGFDPAKYPKLAPSDIMTLQGHAYTQTERQKKDTEQKTATTLFQKAIDGTLSLDEVRQNSGNLEYHDARDLEKLAVEADPVTRGDTYATLLNRIANGENVSDDIRTERFQNKALSNQDFKDLLDRSAKGQEAFNDPVKAGEKYVIDSVGAAANTINVADSRVIGRARIDYQYAVEKFRQEKKRAPTLIEAQQIGNKIVEAYDSLDLDKIVPTLPKPQFMTVQEKNTFNSKQPAKIEQQRAIVEKSKQATRDFYLKQYGGNKDAAARDADFLKEMERIRTLENLITAAPAKVK